MFELIRTNSENPDYQKLVILLDAVLREYDGEEHAFYAQYNKSDAIKEVVVAYENDNPVGCGAIKKFDDAAAEVKRMYVNPDFRGKGFAKAILLELEKWAGEIGFENCILETGKRQLEAIALYKKCGYLVSENYGQYKDVENSICMKKNL